MDKTDDFTVEEITISDPRMTRPHTGPCRPDRDCNPPDTCRPNDCRPAADRDPGDASNLCE